MFSQMFGGERFFDWVSSVVFPCLSIASDSSQVGEIA